MIVDFCDLHFWADVASVGTCVVAVFGYLRYRCVIYRKSKRLVEYLRAEQQTERDHGERTALHITRNIGLTEDEIIQASFHNPRIGRRVKTGENGLAERLLFVYQ
jgi:hypothetical protein